MREIRPSSSMSGDGEWGVAARPELPLPSSLPSLRSPTIRAFRLLSRWSGCAPTIDPHRARRPGIEMLGSPACHLDQRRGDGTRMNNQNVHYTRPFHPGTILS
jgi:hypothetical protein